MTTELTKADQELKASIALALNKQAEAASSLKSGGAYITFKNATLKVDGQPVPNNTADVRVLAAISDRSFYAGAFDPDNTQIPDCYALDDSAPFPGSKNKQADTCEACPQNKWGTAVDSRGNPTRGKACKENARLIVIPANVPIKSGIMYSAKVPVTSLNAVSAFVNRAAASGKLTGEFTTQLSVVEDKKTFFKVHLNIKQHDVVDMGELLEKQKAAYVLATTPYPDIED